MGYMVDKMRNMSFRQYSFEKKLRDIEAEMSGRNRSFLPEITDVNGVVSEERMLHQRRRRTTGESQQKSLARPAEYRNSPTFYRKTDRI